MSDARWIESQLVRLVELFSPSGEEAEIVDHVASFLMDKEFEVRRIPTPGGVDNLVVGPEEPNLVLTAHLDTIRPTWPWDGRAHVEDGLVFGLGVVDDKAGVVAAIFAIIEARSRGVDPSSVGVAIALTVDEEINGTGSMAVAETLQPHYAIALEPTGLSVAVAEAGVVAGSVEVRGRSVHGSAPEYGDNAIVKAARLIIDLERAAFTEVQHSLLGASLPCVQRITGGSPLYAVPDRASVGFDIRVVPGIRASDIVREVDEICGRYGGSLEIEEAVDGFEVDPSSDLVEALKASSRRIMGAIRPIAGVPAWTDAHNFAEFGAQAVIFGPGRLIGSAHQPDEHVALRDVVLAGYTLADLITTEADALAAHVNLA